MKLAAGIAAVTFLVGCASLESQQSHENAQIAMIKTQRDAGVQERIAEAQAQAALYQSLRDIAVANPQHAPAVTVALAVAGVKNQGSAQQTPIIGLQPKKNEALEWVKALTPAASTLISTVGVAAINASVAKTQSDNSRLIQINDANTDAQIIESVANIGIAATEQIGIEVGGDYYSVSDTAVIDQSTNNTDDNSNIYTLQDTAYVNQGTISTDSGNTNSDSYNTTSGDTNTDSQNDNSVDSSDNSTDNSVTDVVP